MFESFFMNNMGHDLFRWKGLSKNGLRIIESMSGKSWMTITQIAQDTGIPRKTVGRKMAKMKIAGLAVSNSEKRGAQYKLINSLDLDKAAEILGTAGSKRRQKERHKRDRDAYRIYKKNMEHTPKRSK